MQKSSRKNERIHLLLAHNVYVIFKRNLLEIETYISCFKRNIRKQISAFYENGNTVKYRRKI